MDLLRRLTGRATVRPGSGAMQVPVVEATFDRPRQSRNAPSPDPALLVLVRSFGWLHALGDSVECEGCANDGEPGYCRGPVPADLTDQVDPEDIYCVCGHSLRVAWYPSAEPVAGLWRCAGQDSEHWPKGDSMMASCGHCGWEPNEEDVAELVVANLVTLSEVADYSGRDYAASVGHRASDIVLTGRAFG